MTPPSANDEPLLTTRDPRLDERAEEPIGADLIERRIDRAAWRDAGRGSWDGDDAFEARAEVDRFLREHFASDEAEML